MTEREEMDAMNAVHALLTYIGENPQRAGLKDTPARVARMYKELFYGYSTQPPALTTFPNDEDGVQYDQIVQDEGTFYSFCEHHMLPFFGNYYFGYIPDGHIVGLSKIARLVDFYAARLQVQERLGAQIVEHFENILKPKGAILMLEARHLCKECRGVRKQGIMRTSKVTGIFRTQPELELKFFELIRRRQ